jgi:hypothetical protein
VREQVQRHSMRKEMGLHEGVSDPPRAGRGVDFRASEGVAHAPVAFAAPQLTSDTDGTERRPLQNDYGPTASRQNDLRLRAAARE